MSKLVCGFGINDADYVTHIREELPKVGNTRKFKSLWKCPFYIKWVSMIERCYSVTYHKAKPSYIGCGVCEEWKYFSNFRSWMVLQKWQDKELDKDILVLDNKIYSPDNCVFLERHINLFLTDGGSSRASILPMGVTIDKGKYTSRCRNPTTRRTEYLGAYDNPLDAHTAWKRKKHEHAIHLAMTQEPKIAEALRKRYV